MRSLKPACACRLPLRVIVSPANNNKVMLREELMKGLARLAVVAALAFAPAAARADMKALEEAARKEGELTWYTAHYTSEGAEELGAEFTKLYGVKVNV